MAPGGQSSLSKSAGDGLEPQLKDNEYGDAVAQIYNPDVTKSPMPMTNNEREVKNKLEKATTDLMAVLQQLKHLNMQFAGIKQPCNQRTFANDMITLGEHLTSQTNHALTGLERLVTNTNITKDQLIIARNQTSSTSSYIDQLPLSLIHI